MLHLRVMADVERRGMKSKWRECAELLNMQCACVCVRAHTCVRNDINTVLMSEILQKKKK